MKRIVVVGAALVVVAGGAIGAQRVISNSDDGHQSGKHANTSDPDVSRDYGREVLEQQAEAQAEQQKKALAELGRKVAENVEKLDDSARP